MSIVRIDHNREHPYVMLNKTPLEERTLSWAAKGLWSYLMSRPDDWNIQVSQLSNIYNGKGGGERAIYSLLKELISVGYCTRIQKQSAEKGWCSVEYTITEFKKSLTLCSDADARKSDITKERSSLSESPPSSESINKRQRLKKETVDVVYDFSELIEKIQSHLKKYINEFGDQWYLRKLFLEKMLRKYGENYFISQFNYMLDQQNQAFKDEKTTKIKKTPRISKPQIYIRLACEKNYSEYEENT